MSERDQQSPAPGSTDQTGAGVDLSGLQAAADRACSKIDELREQRDEAIAMLADWCARVSKRGTGWDDWDEAYKDAAYRPCGIRVLLDAAIKAAEQGYDR